MAVRIAEAGHLPLGRPLRALPQRSRGDRTAWRIAADAGWDDVGPTEHLAVARLQADALAPELESAADGIVPVAPWSVLLP